MIEGIFFLFATILQEHKKFERHYTLNLRPITNEIYIENYFHFLAIYTFQSSHVCTNKNSIKCWAIGITSSPFTIQNCLKIFIWLHVCTKQTSCILKYLTMLLCIQTKNKLYFIFKYYIAFRCKMPLIKRIFDNKGIDAFLLLLDCNFF